MGLRQKSELTLTLLWAPCLFDFCLQSLLNSNPHTSPSLHHSYHKGLSSSPFPFIMELLSKSPIYYQAINLTTWLLQLFLKCRSGYLFLLQKCLGIPTVSKTISKLPECYTMPFTIWTWTFRPPPSPNLHESLCQLHRFSLKSIKLLYLQDFACMTLSTINISFYLVKLVLIF